MDRRLPVDAVDNLDGGPATETVAFALDGVNYEIDLSKRNAAQMRARFAPFIRAATGEQAPPGPPRRGRGESRPETPRFGQQGPR